jgi:hypothetical protein
MERTPRPSAAEAAEILAEMLNKPVSASLIRSVIQRRGKEWNLDVPPTGGTWPVLDYRCEKVLGPIKQEHKTSHDWIMLTAYERHRKGLLKLEQSSAIDAVGYVMKRLDMSMVVDYHPSSGFSTRPALPWEVTYYLRQPVPEYPLLELATALADEPPGERREYWVRWREFYRASEDGSLVRREA